MSIQRVSSKWDKTKVIVNHPKLAPYIPDTRLYSPDHLKEMIEMYDTVYIKPDCGTFGHGVMRAEKERKPLLHVSPPVSLPPNYSYSLRYGVQKEEYSTLDELHQAISTHIKSKVYLVQQGIQLLRYQDRSFDLRVLTQKNLRNEWESTGFIGRVAAHGKVITNYHSGGAIGEFHTLLSAHADVMTQARLKRKLGVLGEKVAEQLEQTYPRIKEIGLDVALDQQLHPWILEVNTLPCLYVFGKLSDKEPYRRIRKYAIAYGRITSSGSGRKKSSANRSSRKAPPVTWKRQQA